MLSQYVRLIALCSMVVVVSSLSFNASAGLKLPLPVVVTATSISGNFGSTRNSANDVEYLIVIDNGASISIFARNAAGVTGSCATSDPLHLATLRDLTDSSYLSVSLNAVGTAAGICGSVAEIDGSLLEPPQL